MTNKTMTEGKTSVVGDQATETPKLCRLRDIILFHLQRQNPNLTLGEIEALESDIRVYIKNFLMTLEDVDAKAEVTGLFEGCIYTDRRRSR
jgi:hypothetical protein